MADPQKLVNKYDFALYEMVQDLTNEFHPVQYKGACYFDMKPKEGIGTDEASLMYLLGNLAPGILHRHSKVRTVTLHLLDLKSNML